MEDWKVENLPILHSSYSTRRYKIKYHEGALASNGKSMDGATGCPPSSTNCSDHVPLGELNASYFKLPPLYCLAPLLTVQSPALT